MELLEKASIGDLDGVKTLIQRVDVDTTNDCNQTALCVACANGHAEVAQYLLDHGAFVNLGAKPLIASVRNDHYDCVKLLLEHHADVNCTNANTETPMLVALQNHHYSIISLLLQYDAKIPFESFGDIYATQLPQNAEVEHAAVIQKLIDNNLIDLTSDTIFLAALDFAFKHGPTELAKRILSKDTYSQKFYHRAAYYSTKNNWPDILSKLVTKGVKINAVVDGQTLLYTACKEGHEAIVTLLLNNGADPNIASTFGTLGYSLPLQIAVYQGNYTICDMLLAKGAKLDQSRESLLHIACSGGADEWISIDEAAETRSLEQRLSTIRLLLQQEVDVNAISDVGDTALYRACASHQLQVVRLLLEAGADVNLTLPLFSPVIAALEIGNAELIHLLVKSGADAKCNNSNNETCLHVVINAYSLATDSQNPTDSAPILDVVNIIKLLLEFGADVNACCLWNETALYRASKAGCEDIVRLLIAAGAEINGSSSRRPLYAACERGYTQIVDLLLQHGADSNLSMVLSWMFELEFEEREVSFSSLPICRAAQKGYTDIIDLLLKHGADVNKQDSSGNSVFNYFIEVITRLKTPQVLNPLEEKDLNLLKSMLSAGDVNMLSTNTGRNALHVASSVDMCDLMMELIADCNQLTSTGESALDLARKKGHAAALELLLNAEAKFDQNSTMCSSQSVYSSYRSGQSAMPVLCTASKNGSESIVKLLLNHGADANSSDEYGNTALHLVTSNTVVETLLYNGDMTLSVLNGKQQVDAWLCVVMRGRWLGNYFRKEASARISRKTPHCN